MHASGRERAILGGLLLVAALVRLPTLGQPLVEAHPARQAQTAYTAVLFHETGIDLLRPPLPVLGPPWTVPFEFPLFQAMASLVMEAGIAPEVALRATSLACFLLTGALLWLLLRRELDRAVAFAGLAVFLFEPFGLLWSRTAMIEYLATAGGVGFVLAASAWDRSGSRITLAVALGAGAVAMLVKITTGIAWILPAVLLLRRGWPILPAAVAGIPVLVGLAWTAWADAVKAAGVLTSELTSGELRAWNFGTAERRLEWRAWERLARHLLPLGLLVGPWISGVLYVLERRPLWAWLGATIVIAVLAFFPLYLVHDYYAASVQPAAAALLGGGVVAFARRPELRPVAVGVLLVVAFIGGDKVTGDRWTLAYRPGADPEQVLPVAAQIAAATRPDELVAVIGRDWSPAVHLYARRRGIAVPFWATVADLDLAGYRVFVCGGFGDGGPCTEVSPDEL